MYDRENDNRNNEGRQVQQELEDQLRAFGDTMTDAFAHGFEGRGMDIGDLSVIHISEPTRPY